MTKDVVDDEVDDDKCGRRQRWKQRRGMMRMTLRDVEDEGGQQQGLETCRAPGNVSLVILFYFVLY